jgi:hypothetical protein
MGYTDADWIHLAQDRDRVKTVTNLFSKRRMSSRLAE